MSPPRTTAKKTRRRVEIIGFTSSRNAATWDDETVEKWPVNNLPLYLTAEQRFHRLYDLHDEATVREDPRYVEWLHANTAVPVVMLDALADVPMAVPFPKSDLLAWCDANGYEHYFTNSISYLVAHALMEGATEIGIYGVDLAQAEEYASQRPSCEYWIGVAIGRGVPVTIPPTSDLLKSVGLYGFSELGPFAAKLADREKELAERKLQLEQQHASLMTQAADVEKGIYQLIGALEDVKYIRGVWVPSHGNPRQGVDPLAESA